MQNLAQTSTQAETATLHRPVLHSLTGLRWLAALLVFGYHLVAVEYVDPSRPGVQLLDGIGNAGVMLFFVLSGFVLTWSHREGMGVRQFWFRRFARVYPLHLAALALAVAVSTTMVPSIRTTDPFSFAANVLLVNPWVPAWWQAGNPVSWTLACEAFFYFVFPLLVRLLASRGARALLAIAGGMVVIVTIAPLLALWTAPLMSPYSTPLLRLPEFVLGIVAALLVRRPDLWMPHIAVALPVGLVGLALTVPQLSPHDGPTTLGVSPLSRSPCSSPPSRGATPSERRRCCARRCS